MADAALFPVTVESYSHTKKEEKSGNTAALRLLQFTAASFIISKPQILGCAFILFG